MTGKNWNDARREAAWTFFGVAAFPRLAHRLRWPTRLGPFGLLVYIGFTTGFLLALRTWAVPLLERFVERREQAKDELRKQLGREPTDGEVAAHLLARSD